MKKALIVAQEISLNNELEKRSEELKASVLTSESLHLKDLLAFAIQKASRTEDQLEISNEQIVTLKEELSDASQKLESYQQELESYQQELDACHKEMATLAKEAQELTHEVLLMGELYGENFLPNVISTK